MKSMKTFDFLYLALIGISFLAVTAVPDTECQWVFNAWEQASGSKTNETDCCQIQGVLCTTDHGRRHESSHTHLDCEEIKTLSKPIKNMYGSQILDEHGPSRHSESRSRESPLSTISPCLGRLLNRLYSRDSGKRSEPGIHSLGLQPTLPGQYNSRLVLPRSAL